MGHTEINIIIHHIAHQSEDDDDDGIVGIAVGEAVGGQAKSSCMFAGKSGGQPVRKIWLLPESKV